MMLGLFVNGDRIAIHDADPNLASPPESVSDFGVRFRLLGVDAVLLNGEPMVCGFYECSHSTWSRAIRKEAGEESQ